MRAKLLKLIEKNSRIDVPVLAEKLGVSEEQVVNEMAAMESEGIICLSATVTVDEHRNVNADETVSEPYIEDPIVF